ncbi:MAG: SCO family protein [Dehalococcoidia bacterium]|nr:SCO family protein [Dehalococcoidia bacterium]
MTSRPTAPDEASTTLHKPSLWLLATLATALVAAAVVVALAAWMYFRPPVVVGTRLQPPREALDFQLTDQFGHQARLSDFSSRVVVLTFLYTSCPDVCPLTTAKLHRAHALLGNDAQGVTFVAVTVDPERDTVERLHAYSVQYDMLDKWRFLTGTKAELAPLWQYYWVGEVHTVESGESESLVEHTAPIHVIAQGQVQVAYGQSFQASELAHDLRLLLR